MKGRSSSLRARAAFTLLEVLISIVILSIAMTIAWQTFSSVTTAWTGGREMLDRMHHGDFVLDQLSSALRSMVFFDTAPDKYGFRMENNSAGYGEHTISWVTASGAFLPPDEAMAHGLHRIQIGAGTDANWNEGLIVTVWPYLADEETVEKKHFLVSEVIKGLRCRAYDVHPDEERWRNDWEDTNSIPGLVEITLYADPAVPYGSPVEFRQIIEIPLGPEVTNEIREAR